MSIQKVKSLQEICERERTVLSTIISGSMQNTQVAAFLQTGD